MTAPLPTGWRDLLGHPKLSLPDLLAALSPDRPFSIRSMSVRLSATLSRAEVGHALSEFARSGYAVRLRRGVYRLTGRGEVQRDLARMKISKLIELSWDLPFKGPVLYEV
jgi:hypothetical protein